MRKKIPRKEIQHLAGNSPLGEGGETHSSIFFIKKARERGTERKTRQC